MNDTPTSHSHGEVLALLQGAEVVAVATMAGEKIRTRMMHFAAAACISRV